MPDRSSETVFLSGFMDPLGRSVAESLVRSNPEGMYYLLVQEKHMALARQYCARIAERLAADGIEAANRMRCLTGIITQDRFGLDAGVYRILTDTVTQAWHFAGGYDLSLPKDVAYKVNVIGTRRMLDLASSMRNLKRFLHLSTTFVSGLREGLVLEHELDESQGFNNFYESTKFKAEVEVRRAMKSLPATVFRPGMVIGDSRTGVTGKFDGIYHFLLLFRRLRERLSDTALTALSLLHANIGREGAWVHLAPADFVVEAMTYLAARPEALGETFHLVPPEPTSAREVYETLCDLAGVHEPHNPLGSQVTRRLLRAPRMDRLTGIPPALLDYFNHRALYDSTNTRHHLRGSGIHCPPLGDYLEKIVAYAMSADLGDRQAA